MPWDKEILKNALPQFKEIPKGVSYLEEEVGSGEIPTKKKKKAS